MGVFLVSFISSTLLSLAAVAYLLRLAHKKAWYDRISERNIHKGNVPRLGGIGFGLVFIVIFSVSLFAGKRETEGQFLAAIFALLVIIFSGVRDDFIAMRARSKLLFQSLAALCVIIPGYVFVRIICIENIGILSDLQLISIPITIIWIVGITNAVNLIDGVDGLAGGLSALIVFFFGIIFFLYAYSSMPLLFSVSLFGAILGFMFFNAPLPKAKIFMGDGGSQFLGFSLALLPLLKSNNPAALPVLYAAALLAIPILDTVAVTWGRIRDGKKIYVSDKSHIHHKLLNLGFSAKGVNALLYSLQIILGILVLLAIGKEGFASLYLLGAAFFAATVFFVVVHFLNRKQKNAK